MGQVSCERLTADDAHGIGSRAARCGVTWQADTLDHFWV